MLTILTPTYNRGYTISKAYKSLLKQKDKDFEWLVIDDGSTDNTKEIIDDYIKENKINIGYYKKKNGGKHTAVNYGVKKANGDSVLILDSDDYLTDDAVRKINSYWKKYFANEDVCALSFLKAYPDNKVVSKAFEGNEIVSDTISFKYNKAVKLGGGGFLGDMAEVYKTDILRKYPFPTFDDEKFLSEAIVWNKIAFDYKTVYINKTIYICEYLEDGLSKSCLKSRINCPVGALENAKLFLDKRFKLYIRIKNSIIYTGFSLIKKRSFKQIVKYSNHKLLVILFLPLGILFYFFLILKKSN